MVIYVFPIGVLLFQSLEKERKRNPKKFFYSAEKVFTYGQVLLEVFILWCTRFKRRS